MPTNNLTSQLGLGLASKQAATMTPTVTPPTITTPPTSTPNMVPTGGAGTVVNKQSGQTFPNATAGPYTQQNAANIASNPVFQAPNTTLGEPIKPLSFFMNQNGGNRQQALQGFRDQRKKPNATNNYNQGLQALGGVNSYLNQEGANQDLRNEVKFGQDAQNQMNHLNQQNGIQTQMNDLSYQNSNTQAQNAVDGKKQSAAYLAGGIGQPGSSVGLAGQQKDIQDATDFLGRLGISHNLQNSYSANNLAYQVKDIQKQIDLNVSGAVQNALVQVGKLDAMGDLNSVESVLKARGDIMNNLKGIRQQMIDQNIPYLKALMDEDVKSNTVDDAMTKSKGGGLYLYNSLGQQMKDKNGQPLTANAGNGTFVKGPELGPDGNQYNTYMKNGVMSYVKVQTPQMAMSEAVIDAYAQEVVSGKKALTDLPGLMQGQVAQYMTQYGIKPITSNQEWKPTTNPYTGEQIFYRTGANGQPEYSSGPSGGPSNGGNTTIPADPSTVTAAMGDVFTQASKKYTECGRLDNMYLASLGSKVTVGNSYQSKVDAIVKIGQSPLPISGGLFAFGTDTENGHTGVVKQVNPDGSIVVMESNRNHKGETAYNSYTVDQVRKMKFSQVPGNTSQPSQSGNQDFSQTEINQFKNYNGNSVPEEYKFPAQKKEFLVRRDAWLKTADPVDTLTKDDKGNIAKLADDFRKEPAVKEYKTIASQRAWIQNIDNIDLSGSDQMGLISNYAKILDPTSVVRDSEYATSAKYSQSTIEAKAEEIKHFLVGGGNLSKEGQTMLKEAIKKRFTAMEQAYNDEVGAYQTQMKYRVGKDLPVEALTGYSDTPKIQAPTGGGQAAGGTTTGGGATFSVQASNGKTYTIE